MIPTLMSSVFGISRLWEKGGLFSIWHHPVLQDTFSIETRGRLLPYIRPVGTDESPLVLMKSASALWFGMALLRSILGIWSIPEGQVVN
jgi:hypothetical protein